MACHVSLCHLKRLKMPSPAILFGVLQVNALPITADLLKRTVAFDVVYLNW